MEKPILCVDFDGVIHSYVSGWKGADIIPDPPVPGAMAWLLRATEYFQIHIYSSRSKSAEGIRAMRQWFAVHILNDLGDDDAMKLMSLLVMAFEKPAAFLTIDDRAICFNGKWDEYDPAVMRQFEPWYKWKVGKYEEGLKK